MTPMRRLLLRAGAALLAAACAPVWAAPDAAERMLQAVSLDNADGVRALLAAGADPNQREPARGEALLIVALREDAMRVFAVLLGAPGVDIEAAAANGNTPLMMAAYKGNAAAVGALLGRGARVRRDGWTALHYAAAAGSAPVVRLLLGRGADVNAVAPGGMTPLMMAAREGHREAARLLIAAGADPARKSAEGARAIDYAAFAGHTDTAGDLQPVTPGPAPRPPAVR